MEFSSFLVLKLFSKESISIESNIDLRAIEYLQNISEAIKKKKVVEISYLVVHRAGWLLEKNPLSNE